LSAAAKIFRKPGGGRETFCDTWANISNINTLEQNREQETALCRESCYGIRKMLLQIECRSYIQEVKDFSA
jgi:hypothetical protein